MGEARSWYGKIRGAHRVYAGKPEGKGVDGRIILKWFLDKWDERHGQDRSGLGYGQVAGFCEHGNEHSGSLKYEEFS
jgi:hypothetical protein